MNPMKCASPQKVKESECLIQFSKFNLNCESLKNIHCPCINKTKTTNKCLQKLSEQNVHNNVIKLEFKYQKLKVNQIISSCDTSLLKL